MAVNIDFHEYPHDGDTNSDIVVSICCLTFNHEKYIAQALDSFLSQEASFNFEILIHDDASTDLTKKILLEYKKKYPKKIRLMLRRKNQYSNHRHYSFWKFFQRARGKYIALCDGDDYWCDREKIQRQVDALVRDEELMFCFHKTEVIDELSRYRSIVPSLICNQEQQSYEKDDVLEIITQSLIHASSFMFTSHILKDVHDLLKKYSFILADDYFIRLICAVAGRSVFVNRIMSVYRENVDGSWTTLGRNNVEVQLEHTISMLEHTSAVADVLPENDPFIDYYKNKYSMFFFNSMCEKYGDKFRNAFYDLLVSRLIVALKNKKISDYTFYGAGTFFHRVVERLGEFDGYASGILYVFDNSVHCIQLESNGYVIECVKKDDPRLKRNDKPFIITPLFRCSEISRFIKSDFMNFGIHIHVDDLFEPNDLMLYLKIMK